MGLHPTGGDGEYVGRCQHCVSVREREAPMHMYSVVVDVAWWDPEDAAISGALSRAPFPLVPQWVGHSATVGAEVSAESPEDALALLSKTLSDAGLQIVRFDAGLVSISDIAEELDVSRETVRLWAAGLRRDDFPLRFAHVGQSQVWAWSEVFEWAIRHGYDIPQSPQPIPLRAIERANGALADRNLVAV